MYDSEIFIAGTVFYARNFFFYIKIGAKIEDANNFGITGITILAYIAHREAKPAIKYYCS